MVRTTISIIGLVAAGAVFFLYTQPAYDKTQAINGKIAEYDAALQKAAELQELKQTLLSRYNTFNPNDIDRLQKLLPDHVDNVRLILDLDSIAGRHGMALQNVVISAPQSAGTTQTAVGALNSSKKKYDSLTLKFKTVGSYDTFIAFIGDLEQSLRIVDLVSLQIAEGIVSTADKNGPVEPVYEFDITIRTYWLK